MTEMMVKMSVKDIDAMMAEIKQLTAERDVAIKMLSAWCVAVNENGPGWDDWDEHYKDAAYRPSPIRDLLDKAIAARSGE